MRNAMQHTEAGRYVQLLCAYSGDAWPDVQNELVSIGAFIKSRKDYVRWAERSHDRWRRLIETCQHPLVEKLMRFLLQQKRVTFAADIADVIDHNHEGVFVSYAEQAPSTDEIQKLVKTLWGADVDKQAMRMAPERNLIKGVCVNYGHQTYNMSYRYYRHHLVTSLRCS